MAKQFFIERRPHNGLTYAQYLQRMQDFIEKAGSHPGDDETKKRVEFTKLNFHRSQRIGRTYEVSPSLCGLLAKIKTQQLWMVLTEVWCGDSSQSLPLIAKYAECNKNITLRILPRDENPDIMDHYLTDGTRSIPILVIFNEDGEEIIRWGPRPKEAVELFSQLQAKGLEKEEIIKQIQLWYGRDRGKTIVKEFTALFGNITS